MELRSFTFKSVAFLNALMFLGVSIMPLNALAEEKPFTKDLNQSVENELNLGGHKLEEAFGGWMPEFGGYRRTPILFNPLHDPDNPNARKRTFAGNGVLGLGSLNLDVDNEIDKSQLVQFQSIPTIQHGFADNEVARDNYLNLFSSVRGVAISTLSYLDKTVAAALATTDSQVSQDVTNQLLKQISWTNSEIANPESKELYQGLHEKFEYCMWVVGRAETGLLSGIGKLGRTQGILSASTKSKVNLSGVIKVKNIVEDYARKAKEPSAAGKKAAENYLNNKLAELDLPSGTNVSEVGQKIIGAINDPEGTATEVGLDFLDDKIGEFVPGDINLSEIGGTVTDIMNDPLGAGKDIATDKAIAYLGDKLNLPDNLDLESVVSGFMDIMDDPLGSAKDFAVGLLGDKLGFGFGSSLPGWVGNPPPKYLEHVSFQFCARPDNECEKAYSYEPAEEESLFDKIGNLSDLGTLLNKGKKAVSDYPWAYHYCTCCAERDTGINRSTATETGKGPSKSAVEAGGFSMVDRLFYGTRMPEINERALGGKGSAERAGDQVESIVKLARYWRALYGDYIIIDPQELADTGAPEEQNPDHVGSQKTVYVSPYLSVPQWIEVFRDFGYLVAPKGSLESEPEDPTRPEYLANLDLARLLSRGTCHSVIQLYSYYGEDQLGGFQYCPITGESLEYGICPAFEEILEKFQDGTINDCHANSVSSRKPGITNSAVSKSRILARSSFVGLTKNAVNDGVIPTGAATELVENAITTKLKDLDVAGVDSGVVKTVSEEIAKIANDPKGAATNTATEAIRKELEEAGLSPNHVDNFADEIADIATDPTSTAANVAKEAIKKELQSLGMDPNTASTVTGTVTDLLENPSSVAEDQIEKIIEEQLGVDSDGDNVAANITGGILDIFEDSSDGGSNDGNSSLPGDMINGNCNLTELKRLWIEASLGGILTAANFEDVRDMGPKGSARQARWIASFCDASAATAFKKLHLRMMSITLDFMALNTNLTEVQKKRLMKLPNRVTSYLELGALDSLTAVRNQLVALAAESDMKREADRSGNMAATIATQQNAQQLRELLTFGSALNLPSN